jgi:hypothetical protein
VEPAIAKVKDLLCFSSAFVALPQSNRRAGKVVSIKVAIEDMLLLLHSARAARMKEKPKVPHINARAETVHKLPLFREAFDKRRCLIPATGFYEWKKREDGKQPYRFRRKDLRSAPPAARACGESARPRPSWVHSACS